MLERYSHVRMAAKREAVEALSVNKIQLVADGKPPTVENVAQHTVAVSI